jgi:hypothetical protein
MLRRNEVMNADDLALQKRPNGLDRIGVNMTVANVLATLVIDCMVSVKRIEACERAVRICHQGRTRLDIRGDDRLRRAAVCFVDDTSAELAVALDHAEHNRLAPPSNIALRLLVRVLVLLATADIGVVGLDCAL